jgi:hypothetical protein
VADETQSLLLRVGIDFEALGQFVEALPGVADVMQAVGAAVDNIQIGNPAAFADHGRALTRALVTGIQAEMIGLNFGSSQIAGRGVAGAITEQLFGRLDADSLQRYAHDVRTLLDGVKQALPQTSQPLVSPAALAGLTSVGGVAANGRREIESLSTALDGLTQRLALLQGINIPKSVVRKTA